MPKKLIFFQSIGILLLFFLIFYPNVDPDPIGRFMELFEEPGPGMLFFLNPKYFHERGNGHWDARFGVNLDHPLTLSQKQQKLYDLLGKFKDICDQQNIKFFFFAGSLLGCYRDHDFAPSDDDIDVGILKDDLFRIKFDETSDYLFEISPYAEFEAADRNNRVDARFIDKNTGVFIDIFVSQRYLNTNRYYNKWRNLDIFAYSEALFTGYVTEEELFPLQLCRFRDRDFYIPHDPVPWLNRDFGPNLSPYPKLPILNHAIVLIGTGLLLTTIVTLIRITLKRKPRIYLRTPHPHIKKKTF